MLILSDRWNQIKADITGLKINTPKYTETVLLGTAIIVGVGIGLFKNYDQAVKEIVKIEKSYKPNYGNKEIYKTAFKRYNNLYRKVKSMF